ncbi:MAG: hypothetical protein JEY96_00125 [Bacteroidales bacterium]|nr:hypothetical protein [Bacteroidales bacterium]
MNKNTLIIITLLIVFAFLSCEKDEFNSSPNIKLEFSKDTILFDTIFTTIGSATKQFTVRNPYNRSIKISSIKLAGGSTSPYRLNIDGYSGNTLNNIELRKKDSIYIFVEITVDPNGSNLPMVVNDSIVFSFNGTQQDINLLAFGQDVHKIDGEIIGNEHWTADKPYLVYNSMLVDTLSTLTIDPGAILHFHKNSRLLVKGTIKANGTFASPIIFQGDRLEHDYDDIPGQWDGIWLIRGSKDNIFNFTEIKNAIIGIQVDTLANLSKPTLQLTNSKILNMTSVGIYAQGSTIYAYNNVIANCGQIAVALTIGGSYEFYHTTIANYWEYSTRTTPSVLLNNYYLDVNNNVQVRPIEKAIFSNCIIYGSKESELIIDKDDNTVLNFSFDHSLIKVNQEQVDDFPSSFTQNILNENPKFKDYNSNDYELDTLSVAKDYGDKEIGLMFQFDIQLNNRTLDNGPDLGAFERIENN